MLSVEEANRIGKYNENNEVTNSFELENSRALGTFLIDGVWVSNPGIEQLKAIGYVELQ